MRNCGQFPIQVSISAYSVFHGTIHQYSCHRADAGGVLAMVHRKMSCRRWTLARWAAVRQRVWATEAAQIVELAVTLPLMVVIFVGIYDFGQAFNLKQKLSLATREAARFGANHSTADLTNAGTQCAPAPDSI